MAYKGRFSPQNKDKYRGDPTTIVYRSSWERQVMKYFDENPSVLEWSSEEIVVPYVSKLDRKRHRYYVDFWCRLIDASGITKTYLIEVKPEAQTVRPPRPKKITSVYKRNLARYLVNESKWEAAIDFCEEKGWEFRILTERHLFK